MKKLRLNSFRLILMICFVFSISFLIFESNLFSSNKPNLSVNADSIEYNISQSEENLKKEGITQIYITEVEAKNKEYDGNTQITITKVVAKDINGQVCNVDISATGNTYDENAGTNKYVTINFEIKGNDAENYEIAGYNYDPVFVDILPYGQNLSETLFWKTRDISLQKPVDILPTQYVYTGIDQRMGVSAYYFDIKGDMVDLFVNITMAGNKFKNEFINAGSYEAYAVLTKAEQNYRLVDNSGNDTKLSLIMNQANPQIIFNRDKTFTYTGKTQSLRSYVSLNNSEQSLVFQTGTDTFVNLEDGKRLTVQVSAAASQNYRAFPFDGSEFFEYQVPESNFIKRTSELNVDNILTEYTYIGKEQTINKVAFINDSLNTEQTILYSTKAAFTNSERNREVTIFALETGNFNAISKTIYINVKKAVIDTSNWRWTPSVFNYDGGIHSVVVSGYDPTIVSVTYSNNSAINAGFYVANASFTPYDIDNYESVSFSSLIWKINKAKISKPILEDRISTYTASDQQIDIMESMYYNIENKINKNAGDYKVYISLSDINNYEWRDGTSDTLSINWTIKKAKVLTPTFSKKLNYSGENLFIQLPASDQYTVLGSSEKEIGNYHAYLLLNDTENYEWEDSSNPYLIINWSIINAKYNSSSSVLVIVLSVFIIVVLAIYITLHFTIRVRRRRRRRQAASQRHVELTKNVNITNNVSSVSVSNKNVPQKNVKDTRKTIKQNENLVKSNKEPAQVATAPKVRKKRMLSMKKNDKKERRKKENRKLAKKKKTPAKRGRPPKKKSKK